MCQCKLDEKFIKLKSFIDNLDTKEGALISVLHRAQELFGYLGEEVQVYVAKELEIPVSKVFGVISFYSYFTTTPRGKHVINICTGTACFVRGAGDVLKEFKNKLNISEGETTEDGIYTLETLRCVGACGLAPVVMVGNDVYGHFKPEDVEKILSKYK